MTVAFTQGAKTPPTLDGLHLAGVPIDQWEVTYTDLKSNLTMADGSIREQLRAPEPGFPLITRKRTFSLAWSHLGRLQAAVEARMAFPGAHRLTLWKHETLGFLGDGQRTEFFLPSAWRVAPHVLTPPDGLSADRFGAEVTIGFDGAPLDILDLPSDSFETEPLTAGGVAFEVGSNRLRFGEAPAAAASVIVRVVPEFTCFTGGESDSRRYTSPVREPRRILLVET